MFLACAQQVADPVERVALAAAVPVHLLLHAASHVVDDLGAKLHDVERVEDRAGVFELVIDGVLEAAERVERRDLHPVAERRAAIVQPRPVRLAGPARDEIEQPRPRAAVDVAGEVDHAGELLRPAPAGADRPRGDVVPDVLVHAQHGHVIEPCRVGLGSFQQRPDRVPDGPPARAQLPPDAVDRGVLPADLLDRPPCRPPRQLRPRRCDRLILFQEGHDHAGRFGAAPAALAPAQPDRSTHRRRIHQRHRRAAVTDREHAAARAADRARRRLDRHGQRVAPAALDRDRS